MNKIIRSNSGERRGFLLRVILVVLMLIAFSAVMVNFFCTIDDSGDEFLPATGLVFFWVIYRLVVRGFLKIPSFLIVALISVSSYYLEWRWGVIIPEGWILLALSIVIAGILLDSRFSIILVMIHGIVLLALTYLQINGIWGYKLWNQTPTIGSILVAIFTLLLITIISWLSNREIENALNRVIKSEQDLKEERDSLEIKVEERTRELRKTQLEKIINLYRFADYGRLTAGMFHDIANPLTQVSLNLSQIEVQTKSLSPELRKIDPVVKRAINGVKQMQRIVVSLRKQIQEQDTKSLYTPFNEIRTVIENFEFKSKEMRVRVTFTGDKKIKTFGTSIRFYQVVSNLFSNAFDSYYDLDKKENREIIVSLNDVDKQVELIVRDFGCGIEREILNNIFDPLFTTKDIQRGTGVGLYISKMIVEQEFGGTVEVESKVGSGSIFTVRFPIRRRLNESKD